MHTGEPLACRTHAQYGCLSRTGHRVAVLQSWWVSASQALHHRRCITGTASVRRARVQPLLGVALVVLVVGGDGDGGSAGTVDVRVERRFGRRTERRVRLDDRVEVAVDDGLHRTLGAVD